MSKKENILNKTYANFSATGRVKVNKNDGFQLNIQSKNNPNYIYSRATLHVDCGKERLSFAQLMGGYDVNDPYPIIAFGKDKEGKTDFKKQIEIEWDDRLDSKVLEQVSDFSLITVGLAKDTNTKGEEVVLFKKFLSPYDAIEYIKENLVEDSVVRVNGHIEFNEYEGKTSAQKVIKSIYLTNATEDKFGASFKQQILIDKDSLGEKDDDGLIPLTGYVVNYNRDVKENVALPYTIYIDPSKYKKWDLVSKLFKPTKKDQILVWTLEGVYKIITETVETTIEDLSDDLRTLVEVGMLSEEEALTRAVGSNRSKEAVLFEAFSTRKNKDGIDEFELQDDLYTIDDLVFLSHFENVPNKKTAKKEESKSVNPFAGIEDSVSTDNIDDIFDDFLAGLD